MIFPSLLYKFIFFSNRFHKLPYIPGGGGRELYIALPSDENLVRAAGSTGRLAAVLSVDRGLESFRSENDLKELRLKFIFMLCKNDLYNRFSQKNLKFCDRGQMMGEVI